MADIKTVKLITGDEIIGKVNHESGDCIFIEKVRAIVLQQVGPQQVAPTLIPWIITDEDAEVPLIKKHMLTLPMVPSKDVEDAYIKNTTNIQIATGN